MTSGEKTNNKTNESFFLHMLMTIVDKYLVFRCVCVVSLSLFSLSLAVKNKKKLHSWFSVEVFEISLLAFFPFRSWSAVALSSSGCGGCAPSRGCCCCCWPSWGWRSSRRRPWRAGTRSLCSGQEIWNGKKKQGYRMPLIELLEKNMNCLRKNGLVFLRAN